jgi:HSP20 family protein
LAVSISRWDPWGDIISLREAMNSLLEESFVRPRPLGTQPGTLGLAVDVLETPQAFIVMASVPGVRPEDVTITVLGDTVRISGERRDEPPAGAGDGHCWLIRERHFGPFDRTLKLPAAVNVDAAAAEFRDGVLIITLPKADEARPRTITVRTRTGEETNPPATAS